MRKYYYEHEEHDEFVRHCNDDCSNVELVIRGVWSLSYCVNKCALLKYMRADDSYRCYVDIPDETKGN